MKMTIGRLVLASAALSATTAMAGVTFYEGQNFVGQPVRIAGVAPDFRAYGLDDRVVSMVVDGSQIDG